MKIQEIYGKILEEQLENKKLVNFLLQKWSVENPDITEQDIEPILTRFSQIKNKLDPSLPQAISFLARFDGRHGFTLFNENNLKDITKYTYTEITSLINEYEPLENILDDLDVQTPIDLDNLSTPEKLKLSKDFWYGTRNCIINTGNFRVYDIPNELTSKIHGFYLYAVASRQWCVTVSSWKNYRNSHHRSFYFVIDETRPETDRFFMSALQYDPGIDTKYRITSMLNDGDTAYSWNKESSYSNSSVTTIYPQLKDYQNLIINKPFTEEELKAKGIMSQVNEIPGSPKEFKRLERKVKKSYIIQNGTLTKPDSWQSLDAELKNEYIRTTTLQNYADKFSTYEFLLAVKKSGAFYNTLSKTLDFIGVKGGMVEFTLKFISKDYYPARKSMDNQQINLLKSKISPKFGIYDVRKSDWYTLNGVTYEPNYKRIGMTSLKDDREIPYTVEIYSISSSPNDSTFYCVTPVKDARPNSDTHILTQRGYDALLEKITNVEIRPGKTVKQIQDFQPDTDIDIKEIKGVK